MQRRKKHSDLCQEVLLTSFTLTQKMIDYENTATAEKDPKKLFKIGSWYEHGLNPYGPHRKNIQMALHYYNLAQDAGSEEAYARYYLLGAQGGDAKAQFAVGKCYQLGYGTESDLTKAIEYYEKAARQGLADAQYALGECYEEGIGTECDPIKAIEYYEKAARQGLADAQYALGECYEEGIGTECDPIKAIEYYEKAAEQGNANAQYQLGKCHEEGIGVEKDLTKALSFYNKASKQGHEEARLCFSSISENFFDEIDAITSFNSATTTTTPQCKT